MQYDISQLLDPSASYRVVNMFHQLWEESGYDYRDVPRPECGLLLVTHGTITYHWKDGTLQAGPGDLLFLPRGCHYHVTTSYAKDYLVNLQTSLSPLPLHPIRLLTGASGDYVDSFQKLMELKLQGKRRSFQANGTLMLLLEKILTDYNQEESGFLSKALPLLTESDLPMAQIAAACGISESGFRAQFRKAKGLSPMQYRLNRRIAKAQYLLESTDLSLAQIAESLHFYDQAYFCKLFRQKTGLSPRTYARSKKL